MIKNLSRLQASSLLLAIARDVLFLLGSIPLPPDNPVRQGPSIIRDGAEPAKQPAAARYQN